ncbi:MAG: organomercurial lyase [Thiohalomonadales bacterium]
MTLTNQKNYFINTDNNLLQLSRLFIQLFPVMNKLEQQLALNLYQQLALGKPVLIALIADNINQNYIVINNIIHSWPGVFFDESNHVIGFWGLTINETPHKIIVNNITVYTWCAWDTLFIPELLNQKSSIYSTCPVTKEKINLELSPNDVKSTNKKDIVVSFLKPDLNDLNNIITNFCHFVFFFSNRTAGEQWCAENNNTFLLTLDDAFRVGKKINATRYNYAQL